MKRFSPIAVTMMLFSTLILAACSGIPGAAQPANITIKAHDYSFEAPAQIEAGLVSITLENEGQEPHHVQLARLNDDVTMEQFQAMLQQGPEAALPLITLDGGPGVLPSGKSQQVTVELTPGHYVLLCFVPSPDGLPHLAKGMMTPLEVVAGAEQREVSEPKADGTVRMLDFSFVLPSEIKAGPQVWEVINEGQQPHEIALIRLAEGKTMADVQAFMHSPSGMPPFEDAGGLQGIDSAETAWLNLDLQPGNYVALCHIPDPGSGKAHEELGMVLPFAVN